MNPKRLVVAAAYLPAYCYVQEGVHGTGVTGVYSTSEEVWTPETAWKEAK